MIEFYDEEMLIERLVTSPSLTDKSVVFLVGSALTAPTNESEYGVPMASSIISAISKVFRESPSQREKFEREVSAIPERFRYQKAFEFLRVCRGQDLANKIVFDAVVKSRVSHPLEFSVPSDATKRDILAASMEEDISGWHINPAVESIAKLASSNVEEYGRVILTSNFDPLLEIAFEKERSRFFRTVLATDGDIGQAQGPGTHIVHFHGYWHGNDTLHTQRQLQTERPKLKSSLSRLIANSIVVVVGYGGWDDVFTRLLIEVVDDSYLRPEILWTFFQQDKDKIGETHADILLALRPGLDRGRVTLFNGIDCHSFFPKLEEAVNARSSTEPCEAVDRNYGFDYDEFLFESDSPPHVDVWVGRNSELAEIAQNSPLVVVTGIGGQGKSALASVYWNRAKELESEFEFVDWRDCREERDTLQSQLLKILERVTDGQLSAIDLGGQTIRNLSQILFRVLSTKRCLLVFDNVDKYVDLESFAPVKGLEHLVDEATQRQHNSKLIFTCRPRMAVESANCIAVDLQDGLSLSETKELFELRGARNAHSGSVRWAHETTKGHPLWLNLIVTQVARKDVDLDEILAAIHKGKGELPEKTLRSIWSTLKSEQQTVLRVMAEMIHPEVEERIGFFVSRHMNWNRYDRALRALKSLNLLVIKPRTSAPDLLDLHPLVKRFIQKEFPRREQDRFVSLLITYFGEQIGKFKAVLQRQPSWDVLDNWLQKVELELRLGNTEEALNTLYEVSMPLLGRGYPEAFLRITRTLFDSLDWEYAYANYANFNFIFNELLEVLCQFGEYVEVDKYLEKYLATIPGKSAEYINYCNLRTYSLWFRGDFPAAVEWGEKGIRLRETSGADISYDCSYNYALSLRDNGNIEKALELFLGSAELDDVVRPGAPDTERRGAFYGNIGRCLHFQGERRGALECYKKSLALLSVSGEANRHLNEGYAKYWIGQILCEQEQIELASAFLESARVRWINIAPPRSEEAHGYMFKHLSEETRGKLEKMGDYEREELIRDWLNS